MNLLYSNRKRLAPWRPQKEGAKSNFHEMTLHLPRGTQSPLDTASSAVCGMETAGDEANRFDMSTLWGDQRCTAFCPSHFQASHPCSCRLTVSLLARKLSVTRINFHRHTGTSRSQDIRWRRSNGAICIGTHTPRPLRVHNHDLPICLFTASDGQ